MIPFLKIAKAVFGEKRELEDSGLKVASIKVNATQNPLAIVDDLTFESVCIRSRVLTATLDAILNRHSLPVLPKQSTDLAD